MSLLINYEKVRVCVCVCVCAWVCEKEREIVFVWMCSEPVEQLGIHEPANAMFCFQLDERELESSSDARRQTI